MSALSDLKSTGLSVLTCERVETSQSCSECREAGGESGGMLLRFATRIGARERVHDGLFCSKGCHDWYHGLRPRRISDIEPLPAEEVDALRGHMKGFE